MTKKRSWAGGPTARDCGGEVPALSGRLDPVLDGGFWALEEIRQAPVESRTVASLAEVRVGQLLKECSFQRGPTALGGLREGLGVFQGS
ncbi:hypothetical protein ACIPW5_33750 [Streptomyces sp. NPDC090077]|uniref:hypothetical protein n=1 Tax=Streptomyces sp. NPDC090077 TaxID=3365938 RepID=UPI0038146A1C